jgi:hypothetical protein
MRGTLAILAAVSVVGMLVQLQSRSSQVDDAFEEDWNRRKLLRGDGMLVVENIQKQVQVQVQDQHQSNHQRQRQRRRLVESESVRFAWGIVSRPQDEDVRQVLRKTYLDHPRICILGDTTTQTDEKDCQIAYTFVLPIQALEEFGSLGVEHDITYLPTSDRQTLLSSWFRYAATADVDYVAKVDATTLLFPDMFLESAQELLGSTSLFRVIGGVPGDRWDCGGFSKWKCRQMQSTFMRSELYFLSADLAAWVPLDIVDQEPHRLSNWLTSSLPQLPTIHVTIPASHGLWEQQPKDASSIDLQQRWEYLKSRQFSRHLILSSEEAVPRWNGTSLTDEFYRRIPWKFFPDSWTRFNLP